MLIQDIIDKITKLLALATSPNEHEAAQATAKAQELLMQHNLSLSAIENDFASSEPLIERTEIDIMGKKIPWKGFLALAIAQTNFCEMYWSRGRSGASQIIILGKVHNVAITKSIYSYLCTTVERLAASGVKAEKRNYREYLAQIAGTGIEAYSPPNWRTWKSSFILGCSRRLCDRLKAQKRAYQSNGIPAEPGSQ